MIPEQLIREYMMGPNCIKILAELMNHIELRSGMKVLDLGCGMGLTSIYLAQEFGVRVFAADLWIPSAENFERFRSIGLEHQIVPIQADALSLPFADRYFDAMVSVDAYHYFGCTPEYYDKSLTGFLKHNAPVAIAVPGMKYELHDNIPPEMRDYWPPEALATWHSADWWGQLLGSSRHLEIDFIDEMACFDSAWKDWLESSSEYAIEDRTMMAADKGRYMNLLSIIGTNRKD